MEAFGDHAGWEGWILPLELDPLLGLSLTWLFASPEGRRLLSSRGKAALGTSSDGMVPAELPPEALGDEVYKVVLLSVPFYEALELLRKGATWFLSGLSSFHQEHGIFFIPPSLARPAGEISTCLRRRKDLMNCKRMRPYLPSWGYALVGSFHFIFFPKSAMENLYKSLILAAYGAPESENTWFQRAILTLNCS